ncbi:hypothetical protein PF007_g32025 [Phytophthora fragariae]|uniref:Uncharacterized protein n=1 Tax=Phytophthora fragariae TaxID=53985 RepID=A0A6A3PQR8_9STRA|nr:hypothetical protein PF003_g8945 [Phytophthora fragariae]KAE9056352.1 hypothetical protein PF007_g32025 [Phytophthora fragariae]
MHTTCSTFVLTTVTFSLLQSWTTCRFSCRRKASTVRLLSMYDAATVFNINLEAYTVG